MPVQPDPAFLKGLYEKLKARAAAMAPQVDVTGQSQELKPDEISMLWNRRHMTLEQEWELWRQGRTPGDTRPQLTPEEIGLLVFKDREKLAKMGGRIEPKDFTMWANAQAKREEAKQQEQPPPEPMPAPSLLEPPAGAAPPVPGGL